MQQLNRKWKIYVIHHSHSDIGYTERQEKIEQYHVDYVRQAVRIVEEIHSGNRPEWQGFKWTCETFWAVERFLEKASPDELEQFERSLRQGDMELSGTYLNMTELIDYEIAGKKMKAAGEYARSVGVTVNSAMTADINGYSWGYSQALHDAGIENLLSCVHTHHGMFAIGRKQTPFYWETPKGDKVLVWNGEHYMLGNDLGLSPGAVLSYTIRDEFEAFGTVEDHWKLTETRIHRYLSQLETEDYPYSFALVNVMGLLRDNAAPNGDVMAFIQQWNEKHGDRIEIEMTTLSRFFEQVRKQSPPIPVYRGDWPDWWTDGVISTAVHTQVFRDAQRALRLVKKLGKGSTSLDTNRIGEAEHQLMMYAEHTWGYHSSVYEPWHPMVQALAVRKEAYAAGASRSVYTLLDEVLHDRGEALLAPGLPFRYKVVNPYDFHFHGFAHLYLDSWEPSMFPKGFEVYEETDNEPIIPHQMEAVSRGNQISIWVELAPREERVFRIRPNGAKAATTTSSTRLRGNDRVNDLLDLFPAEEGTTSLDSGIIVSENHIESEHVCIRWAGGEGIVSWIDKSTGADLIREDHVHGAFTPVYEVTPSPSEAMMVDVRRRMGRNRKGPDVRRYAGQLTGVQSHVLGELYAVVELRYELEGSSHYSLYLKIYRDIARVDVSVRIHKDSVWDPENLYLSLPFRASEAKEQLWLNKMGANVRPGIDQLPGTCRDYYCIQEGIAFLSEGNGFPLSAPDTPLIQTGPLEYGRRFLQGQQKENDVHHPVYAWLLSNYWETNFKATLGGFYEFRYRLQWGAEWNSPEKAFQQCAALNMEIPSFRTKQPDKLI